MFALPISVSPPRLRVSSPDSTEKLSGSLANSAGQWLAERVPDPDGAEPTNCRHHPSRNRGFVGAPRRPRRRGSRSPWPPRRHRRGKRWRGKRWRAWSLPARRRACATRSPPRVRSILNTRPKTGGPARCEVRPGVRHLIFSSAPSNRRPMVLALGLDRARHLTSWIVPSPPSWESRQSSS
jgi:hypothetical protein